MRTFTREDAELVAEQGVCCVKRPNPVFLMRVEEPFIIESPKGRFAFEAGDHACFDPLTGNLYAVSAEAAEAHYVPVPE